MTSIPDKSIDLIRILNRENPDKMCMEYTDGESEFERIKNIGKVELIKSLKALLKRGGVDIDAE